MRPGRKHERPIVLADWQREIVDRYPEQFLRGLIHSDGCRTVNRFKTKLPSGRVAEYEYPRYFFSNLSVDIRALFCEYCERLGVRWTQSNPRNISVSHRASVAILDGVHRAEDIASAGRTGTGAAAARTPASRDEPDAQQDHGAAERPCERWIASSRNSAPQSTPNTGTT